MALKNYNAFIKAVKQKYGISHREAQLSYRQAKSKYGGRKFSGADVRKNRFPLAASIKQAKAEAKREKEEREARQEEKQEGISKGSQVDYGETYDFDYWEEWAITFSYGDE